ncbi:MAG: hypothetical protein Q9O62_05320 [Ardenticatenia bacterium]|nr:hypothetical protein [Ardenticatenia bacterium]
MTHRQTHLQRYVADAPEHHVRAAIPLVLAESGAYRLHRIACPEGTAWAITPVDAPDDPLAHVLLIPQGEQASAIVFEVIQGASGRHVAALQKRLVGGLRRYGFHVEPDASPRSSAPDVLVVVGSRGEGQTLAVRLTQAIERCGHVVHHVLADSPLHRSLVAAVRRARCVVADVSVPAGRRAAVEALRHNKPLVPVAPADTVLPRAFANRAVRYVLGDNEAQFAQAVCQVIQAQLQAARDGRGTLPVLSSSPEPLPRRAAIRLPAVRVETSGKRPAEALLEMRRQIYRRIAVDPAASPLNRLHAARVLAASRDREHAARALGALTQVIGPANVAHMAMEALVDLGQAALPVLWELDATEHRPERLLEIARRLAQAGDPHTARLRLEELATYAPPNVQRDAFRALIELELTDPEQLQTLAQNVQEAELRVQAALGLRKITATRHVAITVLQEVAMTAPPDVALPAVNGLVPIRRKAAVAALEKVAREAPSHDVRLEAARALLAKKQPEAARQAFFHLALHSTEEHVALAAVNALLEGAQADAGHLEQLLQAARLPAVRRAVALRLVETPALPESLYREALAVLLDVEEVERTLPLLERFVRRARQDTSRRWAIKALLHVGERAERPVVDVLHSADRATAMAVATAVLQERPHPRLVRRVAAWLIARGQPAIAASALAELACQPETPPAEAMASVTTLVHELEKPRTNGFKQALVARLSRVAQESPHADARHVARQALLRHAPAALPTPLLVDALTLNAHVPAALQPALRELVRTAPAATQHIVGRLIAPEAGREQRWRLLTLLSAFPPDLVTTALSQVVSRASDPELIYAAADRLLALGSTQAALAALATLAERAADTRIRHQAVYRLACGATWRPACWRPWPPTPPTPKLVPWPAVSCPNTRPRPSWSGCGSRLSAWWNAWGWWRKKGRQASGDGTEGYSHPRTRRLRCRCLPSSRGQALPRVRAPPAPPGEPQCVQLHYPPLGCPSLQAR